jgi:cytidyltransferase-like protein
VTTVLVAGAFDDFRSGDMRFLHAAAGLGEVTVALASDAALRERLGRDPKFPEAERRYLLESVRFVRRVVPWEGADAAGLLGALAAEGALPAAWVTREAPAADTAAACRARGVACRALAGSDLEGFPELAAGTADPARRRVIVTGCYDWFHSGHVRFFEEVAQLGDLYVVVGHDANIRLLKGEGHPLLPEAERRYMVQGIRFVKQALISTGQGWMDAEPEIARLRPQVYAVNEDGDRPEKRTFCREHGLEYVVLKRLPKPGLPRRQSTDLRGF